MNDYQKINELLIEKCDAKADKIFDFSYQIRDLSFLKLRDILIMLGRIHLENLEENIYLALIPGGFRKKNTAYVAFKLTDSELFLASYSEEGLIKQNTSKGVIYEIGKALDKYIVR